MTKKEKTKISVQIQNPQKDKPTIHHFDTMKEAIAFQEKCVFLYGFDAEILE